MIRWELYKLVRQRRTLFGLGAMALVPVLFVAALEITREGPPEGEAPFATQLLENGLVVPLVTLAFATFVLLPLVVAFVAGDAVAGEVSAGTLKTVLSRSVGRTELFLSKAAALGVYCLAVSAVLAGVGLVAGYLAGGFAPLAGLGGTPISVGRGIALVWAGAGLVSVPLMALAAFAVFLSVTTHNSVGSGVGAVVLVLLLRLASGPRPRRPPGPLPAHEPVRGLAQPRPRPHSLGTDSALPLGQPPLGDLLPRRRLGGLYSPRRAFLEWGHVFRTRRPCGRRQGPTGRGRHS